MQKLRTLSERLFGHPSILLWLLVLMGLALIVAAATFAMITGLRVNAGLDTPTAAGAAFVTPTSAGQNSPPIQLMPAEGGPGVSVTVAGQGWQPADTLLISLENPSESPPPQTAVATVQVTEQGTFVATFIFPTDAYWANLPRVLVTVQSATMGLKSSH
ncbi:MAG TPA: hypothetical protein VEC96_12235, partial [Anaerolineae bacterium]|nr:hypothetical protein [Anaerolineae bacterium]